MLARDLRGTRNVLIFVRVFEDLNLILKMKANEMFLRVKARNGKENKLKVMGYSTKCLYISK